MFFQDRKGGNSKREAQDWWDYSVGRDASCQTWPKFDPQELQSGSREPNSGELASGIHTDATAGTCPPPMSKVKNRIRPLFNVWKERTCENPETSRGREAVRDPTLLKDKRAEPWGRKGSSPSSSTTPACQRANVWGPHAPHKTSVCLCTDNDHLSQLPLLLLFWHGKEYIFSCYIFLGHSLYVIILQKGNHRMNFALEIRLSRAILP